MVARKAVALIERGRSSTSCDGLLVVLLVVLIVGAPTVFLRSVLFAFAIPQLTMLWVTAMAVFLVGLYRLSVPAARDLGPRLLTSVWIAFASALALTTFFSPQPWVALIGLPGRGAGALTYGFGLVLLHTVYRLGRRRSVEPLLLALVTTHCQWCSMPCSKPMDSIPSHGLRHMWGGSPRLWATRTSRPPMWASPCRFWSGYRSDRPALARFGLLEVLPSGHRRSPFATSSHSRGK